MKQFYINDYAIIPLDRIKDYTWKPEIRKIEMDKIKEFLDSFEWNSIDAHILNRNRAETKYLYEKSEKESLKVETSLSGFDPLVSFCKKTPVEQQLFDS